MQFFSALVAIVGLAGVSKADDGDGAYVGDFSMWNGGQCGKAPGNPIGMWSINKALTESCHLFKHTDENPVRSVLLNFMGEGHTLTVYTSEDCSEGADVVPVGECASSEEGYASFSVSTGN